MCNEIIFKRMVIDNFWSKTKVRQLQIFFMFDLLFNFKNFHVFLVKVLNIISADQNRNMHIFYEKNFQS